MEELPTEFYPKWTRWELINNNRKPTLLTAIHSKIPCRFCEVGRKSPSPLSLHKSREMILLFVHFWHLPFQLPIHLFILLFKQPNLRTVHSNNCSTDFLLYPCFQWPAWTYFPLRAKSAWFHALGLNWVGEAALLSSSRFTSVHIIAKGPSLGMKWAYTQALWLKLHREIRLLYHLLQKQVNKCIYS